jgi:hypothetical protein
MCAGVIGGATEAGEGLGSFVATYLCFLCCHLPAPPHSATSPKTKYLFFSKNGDGSTNRHVGRRDMKAILPSDVRSSQRGLTAAVKDAAGCLSVLSGARQVLEPLEVTETYEGRSGTFGDLALRVVRAGPELRELHLARIDLTGHPDDQVLAALPGAPPAAYHATLLGALPSGFDRNDSGRRSVRTVADLCEALRCDSGLDSADIRATRLGDSGCRLIAKLLGDPQGPPLLRLELGDNSLTDVSAVQLAQALRRNGRLLHLGLDGNRIGPAGALELAALVTVSQSLLSLSLANNERIGARGVAALAEALPDSAPLVHLNLTRCGAGRGGSTLAVRALEASFETPLPAPLREVLLGGNGFRQEQRRALWAALGRGGQILKLGLDRGGGALDPAHLQHAWAQQGQLLRGQPNGGGDRQLPGEQVEGDSNRQARSGRGGGAEHVGSRGVVHRIGGGDVGLAKSGLGGQGSVAESWKSGGASSARRGASKEMSVCGKSATSTCRPAHSVG